jgi:hypothetical protein
VWLVGAAGIVDFLTGCIGPYSSILRLIDSTLLLPIDCPFVSNLTADVSKMAIFVDFFIYVLK